MGCRGAWCGTLSKRMFIKKDDFLRLGRSVSLVLLPEHVRTMHLVCIRRLQFMQNVGKG